MDNKKKCTLAEFSRRALQRMKDKKIPKKQTLHIPSMTNTASTWLLWSQTCGMWPGRSWDRKLSCPRRNGS